MIASLSDLKTYLDISDTNKDTLLTDILTAAEQEVESYLGYDPESQTYTAEKVNGTGKKYIVPSARPITAVSAISIDGTALTVTELADTEIDGWRIWLPYTIPEYVNYCEVTYTAGYSTSAMPRMIKIVVLKLARLMYKEDVGVASIASDLGTTTYKDSMIETYLDMLSEYRNDYA